MEYTEHEKMKKVVDESQSIGNFLEWLESEGFEICEYDDKSFNGRYWPTRKSITQLLADYFNIDLKKIEAEKQEMLEEIRKNN